MGDAWNCYLLAFKNIFDYKNTAERKELNWFILFMTLFWALAVMILIYSCVALTITGRDHVIPMLFLIFFIFAAIYMITHWIPYIALIKRRFNRITPNKSGLFFGIWLGLWFIQFFICISIVTIMVHYKEHFNPLLVFPLGLINYIFSLIFIGTIIFLMVKEKPIV